MMRVAESLGGGARSQRVGIGKKLVKGISVGINRGAGRIMRVKGTGGFVRFVGKVEFAGR